MPVLNVTCPICTEVFGNSDDIYSTSCGHLFHYACMRDWESRSTSCPQCRSYNPTSHKLYLSFDDADGSPKVNEELEIKLKSSIEKIQGLYEQIQEGEINFLHLQEQFNRSEELIRKLQDNVHQLKDSETNFLHLQGQYTESEEQNRELQETVQVLTIENEYKQKEMHVKLIELDTLKTTLENVECQTSDIYLNQKIKSLEQKLKLITAEFEKEISNNTQLSIDNMKLKSYIDRMKLEASNDNSAKVEKQNQSTQNNVTKKRNNNNNRFQKQIGTQAVRVTQTPLRSIIPDPNADCAPNFNDVTTVVIRNFPMSQISYPLENIILTLAVVMNLIISHEDLVKVSIMDKRVNHTGKVSLLVKFRSISLKMMFLSNKNQLKKNPSYGFLTIREHVDDFTNSLFVYANKNLRGNGFGYICVINNQVIVKTSYTDPNSIRITSKAQVDDLLKNNVPSNAPTTTSVSPILNDEVDECFYKK